MFGFLNVYKPKGMTSHDVVSVLRKVTGVKQIGHTGTLDPFAQGVLPVCIGKATRLIEYLEDDKAYLGRFCFGKSTTTYDIEGDTVKEFLTPIKKEDIINASGNFMGEIEQTPPAYSAIKVKGKKLYEYVREGKTVEIKSRKVRIDKFELISFDAETQSAEIYIECSKGTYIRSIANDLGSKLNNGCYLSELKRTKSGRFCVENSIPLEKIKDDKDVLSHLINPIEYLPQPCQELNEIEYERISHGQTVYNRIKVKSGTVILTKGGQIAAVSKCTSDGLKAEKVFI